MLTRDIWENSASDELFKIDRIATSILFDDSSRNLSIIEAGKCGNKEASRDGLDLTTTGSRVSVNSETYEE